jgi:predicted benzoate:H+ symporter BenE
MRYTFTLTIAAVMLMVSLAAYAIVTVEMQLPQWVAAPLASLILLGPTYAAFHLENKNRKR